MRPEQCDISSANLFSRGREEKRPWKRGLRFACSHVVLARLSLAQITYLSKFKCITLNATW